MFVFPQIPQLFPPSWTAAEVIYFALHALNVAYVLQHEIVLSQWIMPIITVLYSLSSAIISHILHDDM